MSPRPRVAVLGGGLAGITAAIALSEVGASVALFEARPRLGGATTSFTRGGLVIDNGQHVFLRCCTAYLGLLARLGMTGSVSLQDRFDITVLSPHGRARLRRSALPSPLHMATALTGYRFLSPAQRLRVLPAVLAMKRLDVGWPGADSQRLGDWLAARWQNERIRRVLWDLFTVSSLNVAGDDASLALAATVVKTALLADPGAADIGTPAVPLGDLHGTAAAALLARLGARVWLNAKADAIEVIPGGGFRVRFAGRAGARASGAVADAVVLAVPPAVAATLMPRRLPTGSGDSAVGPVRGGETGAGAVDGAVGGRGARPGSGRATGPEQWRRLQTSPIVNVHVIYDRRITRLPFAAAVDSPVQWVFDRTGPSGLRAGQYLAVSLSAADAYVDVPAAKLREEFLPALADLFPAARGAGVADFFVTRERRATLRQVPGCGRLRPAAATAIPGLVLAGAWTDTGWPDTMEGAVRSGLNAARELRAFLAAIPGGLVRGRPASYVPAQPDGQAGPPPSPAPRGAADGHRGQAGRAPSPAPRGGANGHRGQAGPPPSPAPRGTADGVTGSPA